MFGGGIANFHYYLETSFSAFRDYFQAAQSILEARINYLTKACDIDSR